jgi:hypothetical protein
VCRAEGFKARNQPAVGEGKGRTDGQMCTG